MCRTCRTSWCVTVYPWVGGAAVEWDAGGRYAAGVCLFDGNGGVRAAGAWRLLMDLMDRMDLMDKMGAPRDNPGVCRALCGLARVMIYRRGMPV